ncbi:MAG: hypothetical protein HEQ27_10530 [Dolichospermum sp. JUN01]|nr:hypothetical protein [Dolichospermum sp. JUN01]
MSTLFTAVSVEQQAIVTGGVLLAPTIDSSQSGTFNASRWITGNGLKIGPGGIDSVGVATFENIYSNGQRRDVLGVLGFPIN